MTRTSPAEVRGRLHRHEDGREHRHFSEGFTIGGQVRPDMDGSEEHSHGILGSDAPRSGAVVWIEEAR